MTDYTIASKIVPPNIDPLAIVGKAQGVQQGQLQNRILGQNIAQTLAQRAAAQASVDPSTGAFDVDKYSGKLAEGGASPEAMLQAQQTRQAQLQAKISGLGLTKAQMEVSAQELGNGAMVGQGILANGTKDPAAFSKEGIATAITDNLLKTGLVKTPEGVQHAQQFISMLTDDPTKNAALVQQFVNESTDITHALGAVSNVDTGGHIVQQRVNPATGEPTTTGVIGKGLSPSEAQSPAYIYTDPDTGQQHIVTKAEAAAGGPPAANGAANGRYPGGGPPKGIVSGMKPGASGVMEESAKTYLADAAAIPNIKRTMTTFDQAFDAMKTAKTGPGSEHLQNLRGIADTYHIPLPVLGNKNETEAYVEANKWLTSALTSEAQRLGLGTDAARALQGEAQPGVHTVQGAAIAMIPVLKGLKAMDMVAPLIAKQQGWTPQNYVEKRGEWANSVDPLAFGADLMPASQRKALIDKMKPDQKARYVKGLRSAVDAGLFTFDDLGK